MIKTAFFQEIL